MSSASRPPTPSQTVGPFFGFALPFPADAEAGPAADSDTIRLEGQVFDGAGEPAPDALLEAWEGDQFARCRTDSEGSYHFLLTRPAAGAVGAPHLELTVFGRGLMRHLQTRIYFSDQAEANLADPVLNAVPAERRRTLIAEAAGPSYRFDIHLQGESETVFFEGA